MAKTNPMKVKEWLATMTENGILPPVELVRMREWREHSYVCRVKNLDTGDVFPLSIYLRGFVIAHDHIDPQKLTELDAEEQWEDANELDVNAVPEKIWRNPMRGKQIIQLSLLPDLPGETPSPQRIKGQVLAKGDWIIYREAEQPTPANPHAPSQPLHPPETHKSGYFGKVIKFTQDRIIVQSELNKFFYFVRPMDVHTIAKKKEKSKRSR
jgi:hypothetical protein